jgi:hypothetical protein
VNGSIRFSFHGGAGKVAHDTVLGKTIAEKDEREFIRLFLLLNDRTICITHMAMPFC